MKLKNAKALGLTLACGLTLVAGTALATAAVTTKTLQAEYANISLVVDGQTIVPKDAAGNVVEPFIVNGTTYLPVRAIGSALGKDVQWDSETKTVFVGSAPAADKNWMKELPPYQTTGLTVYDGGNTTFSVAGVAHNTGLRFFGLYESNFGLWNLDGSYNRLTMKVGHLDGSNPSGGTLYAYLDGKLAQSYPIAWDGLPQEISLNLAGAKQLKLEWKGDNSQVSCGIYDIAFSK